MDGNDDDAWLVPPRPPTKYIVPYVISFVNAYINSHVTLDSSSDRGRSPFPYVEPKKLLNDCRACVILCRASGTAGVGGAAGSAVDVTPRLDLMPRVGSSRARGRWLCRIIAQ